jgi:hypothetical protein
MSHTRRRWLDIILNMHCSGIGERASKSQQRVSAISSTTGGTSCARPELTRALDISCPSTPCLTGIGLPPLIKMIYFG